MTPTLQILILTQSIMITILQISQINTNTIDIDINTNTIDIDPNTKYYNPNTPDIDPDHVEKKGYREWLEKIDLMLQSDEVLSECYQLHTVTDTALVCGVEGVELQLLVSPHWGVPANFYTYLETLRPQQRSK